MKKSKVPTVEERHEFDLRQIRAEFQNTPTVLYKEGDQVFYSRADCKSFVTKVLDDGKILELYEKGTQKVYGKPCPFERTIYVAWHQVTPYRTWDDSERRKGDDRFRLQYCQTMLQGLIGTHYHFGIDFDPDYQRGLVWELKDKQALIQSIFDDIDIGKFVLARLPFREGKVPAYEIVDGKQRLLALIEYFEGRFEWKGRLFRDLHPYDQGHFENYSVNKADLDEPSRKQILDCFVRLNTSGKPQDLAHIEKVRKLLEETK